MWGSLKLLCAVLYHFTHASSKYLKLIAERLTSSLCTVGCWTVGTLEMGHGRVCPGNLDTAPFSPCPDFWGGPGGRHLAKGRRCSCMSQSSGQHSSGPQGPPDVS